MLVCIPSLLHTVYFVLTFRPELLVVETVMLDTQGALICPSVLPIILLSEEAL